jgi:Tfp pilus assembly PilM family ATPase
MLMPWRNRQRTTPIGLDIGECATRAVQLTRLGDSFRVYNAACAERPTVPRGTDRQSESDTVSTLAGRIESCLSGAEFRGRAVLTALSSPEVEFHSLELPPVDTPQRAQIVECEVKRLSTRQAERVQTGYWALPSLGGSGPNAIGVVVPHDKVSERVELCRRAGLVCSRVDTGATALGRFGRLLNSWTSEQIWGLLDLSLRQSRLVLCLADVPVLVRTVGAGGDVWTERIAEALGTSARTAEVHKRDNGIAPTARGVREGSSTPPASELASVLRGILRSALNEMAAEIKRSYEYVLSCYPPRRAADLILVGGGALTRNLSEYLTSALGIPVCRASAYLDNDSCRLQCGAGRRSTLETSALAIGLAVGD